MERVLRVKRARYSGSAKRVRQAIGPTVGYLYCMREKLERGGVDHGDPLYQSVAKAYETLHELFLETHVLSSEEERGGRL